MTSSTEWIFQFWAWQLLSWALYRYFLKVPEWADELVFKPVVFVLPVLLFVLVKEKSRLETIGLTKRSLLHNAGIGVVISALFIAVGMLVNITTHGQLTMRPIAASLLFLSFATAFSEELLSRGFLLSRLFAATKRAWYSVIMSTLLFMAFHIPILVTSLRFQGLTLMVFFWTTLSLGIINGMFYLKTKSLVVPILVHMFWNITAFLFL